MIGTILVVGGLVVVGIAAYKVHVSGKPVTTGNVASEVETKVEDANK